jgi:hypothetical protein
LKNINYFIEEIYNKVRWGEFDYKGRVSNNYYFSDETHEVCYDLNTNSIYVALLTSTGKESLLHLDVENNGNHYDRYLINSLVEFIIEFVIDDTEMERLNKDLDMYVKNEEFRKASNQRDIINNIKIMLSKL